MSFLSRLCVFALIAGAGFLAWQWNVALDCAHESTRLALEQFRNSDGVPASLQQATWAQSWWPLVWPGILTLIAGVMFWDDLERWWKHEDRIDPV